MTKKRENEILKEVEERIVRISGEIGRLESTERERMLTVSEIEQLNFLKGEYSGLTLTKYLMTC